MPRPRPAAHVASALLPSTWQALDEPAEVAAHDAAAASIDEVMRTKEAEAAAKAYKEPKVSANYPSLITMASANYSILVTNYYGLGELLITNY